MVSPMSMQFQSNQATSSLERKERALVEVEIWRRIHLTLKVLYMPRMLWRGMPCGSSIWQMTR